MKKLISIVFGVLLFLPLQAQVYEWFDEAGNRHFSDKKPDGRVYRVLGDPGANLSSYAPSAMRQPRPDSRDKSTAAPPTARPRSASAETASNTPEAVCADYLARIDSIHDRLRAGYDEPRGNQLRAQRSALRQAYRRDCN